MVFGRGLRYMCGRFNDHLAWEERWVDLLGQWPDDVAMSFNRAPTQTIAAFTTEGGSAMRWGLVPSWSKEPATKYATFNAVLETVAKKPLYRGPWKAGQRCVVPVAGYYEWRAENDVKQPYYITTEDGSPLFLGGIWEARCSDEEQLRSCSILTRTPITEIEHLHHRMPVMIRHDLIPAWLETGTEDASALAQDAVPRLVHYAVSRYVSNARNNGPQCIEPVQGE